MVDYNSFIGKFLCHRKNAPMTDGFIFKITSTRIYYTNTGDRWITKDDFEHRTGLDGSTWFWVQDTPIDPYWWSPKIIEQIKKDKKLI